MNNCVYLGLGSMGSKIVNKISLKTTNRCFYLDTDLSSLLKYPVDQRLLIAEKKFNKRGTGNLGHDGAFAISQSINNIYFKVKDFKSIFIVAGIGKGLGSNAAYLAKLLLEKKTNVHLFSSLLASKLENKKVLNKRSKYIKETELIKSNLSSFYCFTLDLKQDLSSNNLHKVITQFDDSVANQIHIFSSNLIKVKMK